MAKTVEGVRGKQANATAAFNAADDDVRNYHGSLRTQMPLQRSLEEAIDDEMDDIERKSKLIKKLAEMGERMKKVAIGIATYGLHESTNINLIYLDPTKAAAIKTSKERSSKS